MSTGRKNILFWDIETTHLKGDLGVILSSSYAINNGKPVILKNKYGIKPYMDKGIVERTVSAINSADILVTWYGKKFDIKFLNTRAMAHGVDLARPKYHLDLWEIAKKRVLLHSNRLASASAFLSTETGKTPILPQQWLKASFGNRAALRYVFHHNEVDVIVLRETFRKMLPIIYEFPRGECDIKSCYYCESNKTRFISLVYMRSGTHVMKECTSCGLVTKERVRKEDVNA